MGTRGREIVGMDVGTLIDLLNRAYASEWLAYYQYWLGAKVIKGPMKDAVAAELNLHANEELNHAVMLAGRIVQLGGTPILDPKDWFPMSPCEYDAPVDPHVGVILEQNIAGEQCAISTYKEHDGRDQGQGHGHVQPRADHPPAGGRTRGRPAEPAGGPPVDAAVLRGALVSTAMGTLAPGLVGRIEWEASARHSAEAWGSGAVPVFATPSLVGLMEAAAMEALRGCLPDGDATVGTRIDVEHLAATPLGDTVRAEARLVAVDGRRLVFEIDAHDSVRLIGRCRHERMIISRDRFLEKLARR